MSRETRVDSIRQRIQQIPAMLEGEWLSIDEIADALDEKKNSVQGTMGDLVERGDCKKRIVREDNRVKALYAIYMGISPGELLRRKWA